MKKNHLFSSLKGEKLQSGQALLVVVLIMVIALTVGLSVAVRSVTNLRTSTESESSERAFSAAEAGIEQSLISRSSIANTPISSNAFFETEVRALQGASFNLNNGSVVLKDEPVDLWLSDYSTDPSLIYQNPWSGNLTVNWGKSTDRCEQTESNNSQAALEVVIITGTKANPKVDSYLLDPCNARASNNRFEYVSQSGDVIDGVTYAHKKTLSITSGLIARIIPLYASTVIGVQRGAGDPRDFPAQGQIVTATGTSDTTKRKIVTYQPYPKLPIELFPFVFFSPK